MHQGNARVLPRLDAVCEDFHHWALCCSALSCQREGLRREFEGFCRGGKAFGGSVWQSYLEVAGRHFLILVTLLGNQLENNLEYKGL